MKARRIDLSDYLLPHLEGPDGKVPAYRMRGSLAELCFCQELNHTGVGLLEANTLAQTILDAPGKTLLLSEMDWSRLAAACQQHKGFTRHDIELVRRVLEAPQVDVAETPKK